MGGSNEDVSSFSVFCVGLLWFDDDLFYDMYCLANILVEMQIAISPTAFEDPGVVSPAQILTIATPRQTAIFGGVYSL